MPINSKTRLAIGFALLFANAFCFNQALVHADEVKAPAATSIPADLLGTWRVTGVLVDTGTMARLDMQYNDSRHMGGILLIAPDALLGTIDTWGGLCMYPTVTVEPTTAGALIKNTMAGRAYAPGHTAEELARFPPETPTPQDYQLPYAGNSPVEPMRIYCGKGRIGGWDYRIGHGTWMLVLPNGKLGIRWADSSVLVLSRVTEPIRPIASFDCAKAGTPVEKTICSSMDLALLDHVDVKYFTEFEDTLRRKARLEHDTRFLDAGRDLKGVYHAWRRRRETCGPDPACLKQSMLELWDIFEKTEIPDFHDAKTK